MELVVSNALRLLAEIRIRVGEQSDNVFASPSDNIDKIKHTGLTQWQQSNLNNCRHIWIRKL